MGDLNTLNDAIRSAVDAVLSDVHTSIPGRVESFDWQTRKASVKPLIKRPYLDGVSKPLPVIPGVPTIFPWGGGASLTYPIETGHTGLLIFSERSLDVWLTQGGDADPKDSRKFDLSDGFFIPGMAPFNTEGPAEDNSSLLLKFEGAKLRMNGGKVALGNGSAELLNLISQLLTVIQTGTNSGGPVVFAPPAGPGSIPDIAIKLALIAGTL